MKPRDVIAPVVLLALVFGLWEAGVRLFDVPSFVLPPPSGVLWTFFSRLPLLGHHAGVTFVEILLGLFLGSAGGFLLAVCIFFSPALERAVHPLIVASQMIPVFAIAPLLVMWFGYGLWPKVSVAALISFFPIVVNTVDGLRSTHGEAIDLFRSLRATRIQIFTKLQLPSSLPLLLSGVKVGATLSVVGATIGEWVGAQRGLGYLMVQWNARLKMDIVFAAILALTLFGLLLYAVLRIIERRLLRWRNLGVG